MEHYAEDPFRTAPPYQAPGEVEPAEPTDDDEAEAERNAMAKVLEVRIGGGEDGRTVAAEALAEKLEGAALLRVTNEIHDAVRDGTDPDHAEIGRLVAAVIRDYALSVARHRGLVETELAAVMAPQEDY